MRSYRCWLLSAVAAVSLWSGVAQAQTFSHSAYLDLDSNPATGCAVTTAAGAVSGIEARLTAGVSGQPPMVTAVTREACVGAGFGAPQAQAAGYPVGLNIGTAGADVVEFATSLAGLGNGGPARIVFVSSSASGADQVTVNGVILQGTTATGFSTPAIIPATGLLTLLVLVGLVLWLVRKHPGFGSSMALLLLLGVGVVWAANFVADGAISDWIGVSPRAIDATNDSTSGEGTIDLVAVFAETEAGSLFLRVDVREAQSNAPAFSSGAATTFTVGTPGTFTVTATGTPTPTLSQSGGTLPNGVTFNPATGVLSGTPAAGTGGTYALQFSATNAQGTTTQSFTLTVNQAPVITSANATTFTTGSAGTFTVTASGFPAPTFALTGTLPSGVTFNSATGVLSGTPGAGTGGSYPLSITATNVAGTSPVQSFTLTVNAGPVFTSANATTFTVGTAGTFTVTATGTPAPTLSLTSGVLPTGVTFTPATGVLAGTPAAGTGGSYALQFTATNVQGSTTQAFTLTVNEAPAITSANATTFTTGSGGTFTVTASGFPAPTFALTGALPSGVTFNTTSGVLSGTPGAGTGGSYPLSITATNVAGTSPAQSFTLTVNDGPIFTSANNTTFSVGVAGSFTVTATGTPAPTLSQTNGTLPAGVTFTAATGVLAGTPAVGTGGSYTLEFSATNAQGTTTQAFTLNVNESPVITSANATTFTIGNASSFTVTASGFPAPTFALVGALPSGVTFSSATGLLSGTPAVGTGGSYPVSITATNVAGTSPAQNFTLTVNAAPTITSANATTFTVGTPGTFTVTTTGVPTVATVALGGDPLPGSIGFLDNGNGTATLSGTPAALTGGVYNLTFTASNGVVPNAVQNFTLTVQEAPQITSANSASFILGNPSSFTFTATGFPAPTFTAVGTLPAGITFNPGTGTLSGTPLAGSGGNYPLTVTASNGVAPDATQNFTLTVQDGPFFTSANSTTFEVGVAGTFTVTATGSPTPTLSLTLGALPGGVTFVDNGNGTGTLSGTPGAGTGGSYVVEFSATNAQGTATQSFTLNVNQTPVFTSANATTFLVGSAGTFSVTASGFPTPTFSFTGSLPTGVSFTAGGLLSGTPAAGTSGTYPLTFTADNGVGVDPTQNFTLTVNDAPTITSANATTFIVGTPGSFTVTTTGTPTPSIARGGVALPSGVTFLDNGNGTGTLSGTPAAATGGTYAITFTATNVAGSSPTQNFTLTVQQAPAFTSADNTAFAVGTPGTFTVTASGFPTPTLSLAACTPVLPGSISFVPATGVLSGTPVNGDAGSYSCPFTASNGVAPDANQTFTLTINQAPVAQNDAGVAFTVDSGSTLALPAGTLFADNGSGADARGFPLANIASFGGGSAGGTVVDSAAGSADTTIPGFTNGSLTINADGSLSFTPPTTATRFCGTFTTDYRLTNTQGSDDATVSITVRCAPIAQNDLFNGGFGSTLTGVTRNGDLNDDNGSGADDLGSPAATLTSFGGGSLGGTVTTNAAGTSVAFASGTLTVNADGTFTLVDVDTAGTFTFDYRLTNASGTEDATVTFVIDAPPAVSSTVPLDNAINVANTSDVVVNFSETVTITAGAISVDCGSGPVAGVLSGTGTATATFNPTANLPGNATCVVTVLSANITDTDTNDAPNFLDGDGNGIEGGNFSFDFTVAPTANDDAYTVTPHLTLGITGAIQGGGVRGNDDPTSVTITGFGGTLATANGTVPNGTNSVTASGVGGAVVMNADGTFTFFPDAGDSNAAAMFFYTVTGGDTAQVTLTLQNQELIWFVDDNAAGTVCTGTNVGTQACPATTLAAGAATDTANDTLFVATGAYTCGITLTAGERLVGDGTSGITLATLSGVTPIAGSSLPGFSGIAPTISGAADCVTLASGNTLRGFTIGDSGAANTDVTGTNFGTLTVDQVTLNGTGRALNLDTGAFAGAGFVDVATTSSSIEGIRLNALTGIVALGTGAISGTTGIAFHGTGTLGTVTYAGTLTKTTDGNLVELSGAAAGTVTLSGNLSCTNVCDGIDVVNRGAGTITFSGATKILNTGTSAAVTLDNNDAATIDFTGGGLDIDTTSGSGFSAINGASAITVQGSGNSVTSSTGMALNVASSSIGAAGIGFESISSPAAGAGPTISLTNSGSGGVTVTGTGTAGSGGTIDNKTSDAVVLNTTGGLVTLNQMIIEDIGTMTGVSNTLSGHDAIQGLNVNGGLSLTGTIIRRISDNAIHGGDHLSPATSTVWNGLVLTGVTIEDTNRYHVAALGDANNEGSVRIVGLRGTVSVTGSLFQRGAEFLDLFVAAGTLNLTVTGNDFFNSYKEFAAGDNSPLASVGNHCVDVIVQGAGAANVTIGDRAVAANGNDFLNCRLGSVRVVNDTGSIGNSDFIIARNTFTVTDGSSGVFCTPACVQADFDFPMGGVLGWNLGTGTVGTVVETNTFTDVTNASGGVGQLTLISEGGLHQALVQNNTFIRPGNAPMLVQSRNFVASNMRLRANNNSVTGGPSLCTVDASCAGGYSTPGLRTLFDTSTGATMDLTMDNNQFAGHDTGFDPGETVEVRALSPTGGTVCTNLTNNRADDGYSLEEMAGTMSTVGAGTCSVGGPSADCQTVLGNRGNRGGANNVNTNPPFVRVTPNPLTVTGTACPIPSGGPF